MLPDWLLPDVASIRAEADVRPSQLFTLVDENADDPEAADEAKLVALIESHIQTQGVAVWGKLASESRSMPFPVTLDVLATAYPLDPLAEATEEILAAQTASDTDIIENQKAQAQEAVRNLVIAKLYYGVTGDEAKEKAKGYWITAQSLITDQRNQIKRIRRDWQANSVTLDVFY